MPRAAMTPVAAAEIYLRRAEEEGYPVVDASRPPDVVAREVANIIRTKLGYGENKR
jgi:dTMP kinase